MSRRRPARDLRQAELLLPILGRVPSAAVWAEGSWQRRLVTVIAVAGAVYGKAQVAVWAGSDQRTVENWIAERNLPSLDAAMRLAQHLPDVRRVLEAAMLGDLKRGAA